MSVYGTTHTGWADDTRLYSYTHRSVTIYVYTICLSLLNFLCLMQFEDITTFKIQTALPVYFCQWAPCSTFCCLFLTATNPDSLLLPRLYWQCRRIETFGTGTRIKAQPNFDDVTKSSVNYHIGRDSNSFRKTTDLQTCATYCMPTSIQAHAKNILTKVLSERNKLHFTINATAALNNPQYMNQFTVKWLQQT